jgi:hypothetical protein
MREQNIHLEAKASAARKHGLKRVVKRDSLLGIVGTDDRLGVRTHCPSG